MSDDTPKDWRELCRRAAQELDPEKLLDLIVQINKALDEHAKRQKGNIDHTFDPDQETEALPQHFPVSKLRLLCLGRASSIRGNHFFQSFLPA